MDKFYWLIHANSRHSSDRWKDGSNTLWRVLLELAHLITTSDIPFFFRFLFFFFLGPYPQHMEISSLGIETELQLLAYFTATAVPDMSHICDLHHSSQQCQILNPPGEARDRSLVLVDTGRVHYRWVTTGTPFNCFLIFSKIYILSIKT